MFKFLKYSTYQKVSKRLNFWATLSSSAPVILKCLMIGYFIYLFLIFGLITPVFGNTRRFDSENQNFFFCNIEIVFRSHRNSKVGKDL